MATSTIKKMDVKSGGFSKSQGGESVYLVIKQYGNVVAVHGFISNVTLTANTATKLGNITGVGFPPDSVRCVGSVGANAYTMGTASYVAISGDGELFVTSSNGGSGKTVFFSASYITND